MHAGDDYARLVDYLSSHIQHACGITGKKRGRSLDVIGSLHDPVTWYGIHYARGTPKTKELSSVQPGLPLF